MDRSGRAKRLVLALAVGAMIATLTFLVTSRLANPDSLQLHHDDLTAASVPFWNAMRFVWFATGLAGALALVTTLAISKARANKR